jgi:hypothetical protein
VYIKGKCINAMNRGRIGGRGGAAVVARVAVYKTIPGYGKGKG